MTREQLFPVTTMLYQVSSLPSQARREWDGAAVTRITAAPIPTEELLAKHQRNVDELFAAWRKR